MPLNKDLSEEEIAIEEAQETGSNLKSPAGNIESILEEAEDEFKLPDINNKD